MTEFDLDADLLAPPEAEGSARELAVRDDGPAIAPEFQERIRGIVRTLASRDRVERTVIGLSVVRKLVESPGSGVWVESSPGEGRCSGSCDLRLPPRTAER